VRATLVHDFLLPTESKETLSFDQAFRAQSNSMLYFFRGWW
jgi:hypothetical protein